MPHQDGSYLQRIVSRATGDGSGTLRPQRLIYASSPAPSEGPRALPPTTAAVPPTTAAVSPMPPVPPADALPAVAPLSLPSAVADAEIPAKPGTPVPRFPFTSDVATAVAGPTADGGPVAGAGERSAPRAEPVEESMPPERPGAERTAITTTGDDPVRPPGESHRAPALRRDAPPPPDPLALALAAAVRWTSSGERPGPVAASPQPVPPADAAPSDTRAVPSAAAVGGPGAGQSPPHALRAARPQAADTRVPPTPRRFSGVHIDSIEVRIQPSAPAPSPVPPVPAPSSAAPVIPLARGLTSSIGLRQS